MAVCLAKTTALSALTCHVSATGLVGSQHLRRKTWSCLETTFSRSTASSARITARCRTYCSRNKTPILRPNNFQTDSSKIFMFLAPTGIELDPSPHIHQRPSESSPVTMRSSLWMKKRCHPLRLSAPAVCCSLDKRKPSASSTRGRPASCGERLFT